VRLFVAIGLPESWKQILAEPAEKIGWLGRGVKWVEPRGMHLTLRFLGEVEDRQLSELQDRLHRAAHAAQPFSMRIHGTGTFPNPKRPRIYWAGLEAGPALMDLQARIEDEMQTMGFEAEEQRFHPHLTLARIKDPIGKQRMTDALLSYRLESEPITVHQILLMRSHLSSEGAHYEPIQIHALGAS
jgi:RNA 2',3'-cyclic 3'-phosphodiesterase